MTRHKRRERFPSSRSGRRAGFTYAELLMTTLLLTLCTGVLCLTASICARQARIRADNAQALLLLNAVRDALRNDLTHSTHDCAPDWALRSAISGTPSEWVLDGETLSMIPPEMFAVPDAEETLSVKVQLEFESDGPYPRFTAAIRVYGGDARECLAYDSVSVIPIASVESVP